MKRSNIIGIIAAAVVIIVSVVLISWYLRRSTPTLIQGTVECTTYKASSKVPGRIDDMKVAQGDRVEKGQLLYTLSTPELEAKLRQAEAVKSAAAALDASSVVERTVDAVLEIGFGYLVLNDVMRIVKEMQPQVLAQRFDNACTMTLAIRSSAEELLRERLAGVEGLRIDPKGYV